MTLTRASHTADRVAARRAAHQKLDRPVILVDAVAERLLAPDVAARLQASPGEFDRSPFDRFLRAFLVARSRFAEDCLAERVADGVSQYVVIGAGFDTFAYRNPHAGVRVLELDHPATQARKKERLAAAGLAGTANVRHVAVDLAVTPLRTALEAGGFEPSRPAVFAWLGVVPYLERAAIESVFRDVAALAPGSEMVLDYGVPPQTLSIGARLAIHLVATRVALAGEPWKTYFSPQQLADLLKTVGLTLVEDLSGDAINRRYFTNRTDGLRVSEAGRLARVRVPVAQETSRPGPVVEP